MALHFLVRRWLSLLLILKLALAQNSQPRTLIFPPTTPTRIQFIGGIGIPVEDLTYESVTSGYVLKAEYFLPTEAHELHPTYQKPQNIHERSFHNDTSIDTDEPSDSQIITRLLSLVPQRQQHKLRSGLSDNFESQQKAASAVYRWIIYQGIESALNSSGLPGHTCLLRSICEHAAVPLHYGSGILAEILHIVLSPSKSNEKFSRPADVQYAKAEKMGRSGSYTDCERAFSSCQKSPIDLISTVFDLD